MAGIESYSAGKSCISLKQYIIISGNITLSTVFFTMTKATELRIKTNPSNSAIVDGSTPVVFFGNIKKSTVATLGINPSKNEFKNNSTLLIGREMRFETLTSLSASNLSGLTNSQVQKVYDTCLRYFKANPYRKWFDQLQNNILEKFSVSYYSDTACHLDIVQWATDPIWRSLDYTTKYQLIQSDIDFLATQLNDEKIEILLINGIEATGIFLKHFKPTLIKQDKLVVANKTCNVYQFDLQLSNKQIKTYAWSNNLQSTVGLTNQMRTEIGNWIGQ